MKNGLPGGPSKEKPKTKSVFRYPHVAGVPFQQAVNRYFGAYRYKRPVVKSECKGRSPPPFAKQQNFVRSYIRPSTPGAPYPFGGLFLYHAAGTGKTCAAATIMSKFLFHFADLKWRVIWVTRRTQKTAVLRALFYDLCLPELRSKVLDSTTEMFGTRVGREKMKKLREAYTAFMKGSDQETLKSFRRRYVKKLPQQNIITYGDFVRACARSATPSEFAARLAHDTSGGRASKNEIRDPLHKTLIVIDEAHNLFNMTDFKDADFQTLHETKFAPRFWAGARPMTGLSVIEAAIWNSFAVSGDESCLVVPLTATPMPSSPTDLLRLLNLLIKDPTRRFPSDLSSKTSLLGRYATASGDLRQGIPEMFTKASNGLISYFSGDKDPRYFALKKWGSVIDISISQVTMDALYECKAKHKKRPKPGPDFEGNPNDPLIACYRRVATVAGVRGKMCTTEQIERALTGESAEAYAKREAAKEAYRAKVDKAWLAYMKMPKEKRGSFEEPPRPPTLDPLPSTVKNPKAALSKLNCSTAYSFVVDTTRGGQPFFTWKLLRDNMFMYAPKYFSLFKTIQRLDKRDFAKDGTFYKHCIYCDTSGSGEGRSFGSKLAAAMFMAKGYAMGKPGGSGRKIRFVKPDLTGPPPLTSLTKPMKRSFAVLSSSTLYGEEKTESRSRATIAAFNDKKNAYGDHVRFILIDDTYKEGTDLFDVKYFHFMEPPQSTATLRQAVARITRRCGSQALPYTPRGWMVEVFMYRAKFRASRRQGSGNPYTTVFSVVRSLFDANTLRAFRLFDEFEKLAMGNAVDRLLNEAVVNFKPAGRFMGAIEAGTEVIQDKVPPLY